MNDKSESLFRVTNILNANPHRVGFECVIGGKVSDLILESVSENADKILVDSRRSIETAFMNWFNTTRKIYFRKGLVVGVSFMIVVSSLTIGYLYIREKKKKKNVVKIDVDLDELL